MLKKDPNEKGGRDVYLMFVEERYMRIVEAVNDQGKMTVSQLSELLNVSAATIRRDLEKLEDKNLLVRTHGGAMANQPELLEVVYEKTFNEKQEALVEEKQRIAAVAATLVQDGDSVLLTPGTTNMFLASLLTEKQGLTIVTNAANISTHLASYPGVETILIGGKLRSKSFASVGPLAEQALNHIRVNKLFLGVDGFDFKEGLTTMNLSEASINRKMMTIAQEVIVVADHTKFGKVMFSHIAPLHQVDQVISDTGLAPAIAEQIMHMGIKLTLI